MKQTEAHLALRLKDKKLRNKRGIAMFIARRVLTIISVVWIAFACGKSHSTLNYAQTKTNNNSVLIGLDTKWNPFPAIPNDRAIPNINRETKAATDLVPGKNYVSSKGSLNRNDEKISNGYILISDKDNPFAYAQYAIQGFTGDRPISIAVNSNAAKYLKTDSTTMPVFYMVGVANFSKYSWEWFGPYSKNTNITINDSKHRDRYLSPLNNLHIVVTTYRKSSSSNPVGVSIVDLKCNVSSTALVTRPIYSKINYLHIGQNIVDPSIKTTSTLSADQYVSLYWNHSIPTNVDDAATYYTVYMKAPGDTQPIQIGKVKAPATNELLKFVIPTNVDSSVKDEVNKKLEGGKTFQFAIKAENLIGSTIISQFSSILIPSVLPPSNNSASSDLDDGIHLSWTKSTNATGYLIYRDKQDDWLYEVKDVNSFIDTDVKDDLLYTYWIKSTNSLSERSGFSPSFLGKKKQSNIPLDKPTNLVASNDRKDGIQLTWTKSPFAQSYLIYRNKQDTPLFTAGNTDSFLDDTISDLSDYTYWIKAKAPGYVDSDFSLKAIGNMISGGGTLPAPKNVSASLDNISGILINWDKVPGATEYAIYRDKQNNQIIKVLDVSSYLDDTVADYATHTYWVKAYNSTDKSDFSLPADGKKLNPTPGDAYEPDNSITEARVITLSNSEEIQSRSIEPQNDEDWVKFDGKAGESYYFWSTGTTDTAIFIYDKAKNELTNDDNSAEFPNFYSEFKPTSTDTFYAKVLSPIASLTGPYDLHFISGEPPLFKPSGLFASSDLTDGIQLNWNKSLNATGYKIYRDDQKVPLYTVGDVDSYLDPVTDSDIHIYWLKAFNAKKESDFSIEATGQKAKELVADAYEVDDTLAEAKELKMLTSTQIQDHSIFQNTDVDWCSFVATLGSTYTFYSKNNNSNYLVAYIYDKSEKEVFKSSNSWGDFRIDWEPSTTDTYYLKIVEEPQANTFWYSLYFYMDGIVEKPQNLNATDDQSDGIELTWDKVKDATEYLIFRDSKNNLLTTVLGEEKYLDNPSDHNSHIYWVKAKIKDDESPFSDSDTGKKIGIVDPDWNAHDISKDAINYVSSTVLNNGCIAIVFVKQAEPSNEMYYSYSSSATPSSPSDWTTYLIDDGYPNSPTISLINNKPAICYIKDVSFETKLFYCYADSENPTELNNWTICWVKYAFANSPSLAEINEKPFIAYNYNSQLKFATSSTLTPIDFSDWSDYLVIDENADTPSLIPQPNGNPAIAYQFMNFKFTNDLKYIYANTKTPSSTKDWIYMKIANNITSNVSLAFVDSKPAIAYSIIEGMGGNEKLQYIYSTISAPTSSTDWNNIEIDANAGLNCSLKVINGVPAISYTTAAWMQTPYLKYSESSVANPTTSKDWSIKNIDSDCGGPTCLIDLSSQPGISYIWSDNSFLKFTRRIK